MQRKNFTPEIKSKIAIEALKGLKTTNEIASEFDCHSTQVSHWKREFLDGAATLFEKGIKKREKADGAEREQLYAQIGELQMQLTWLKKKSAMLR